MKRLAAAALLTAGGLGLSALGTRRLRTVSDHGPGGDGPPGAVASLDGVRVHYVEEGEGAAIVLLHGFGASTFSWRHIIPLLAANHRVIAMDLPGFGFSDRNSSIVLGQQRQAERVAALMAHLGVATATVVGHSMGGAIAQRLAVTFPGRVDRLILLASMDASAPSPWRGRSAVIRGAGAAGFGAMIKLPSLAAWMSKRSLARMAWDHRTVTADTARGYVTPLLLPGTAACLARMAADTAHEPAADLSRLAAPTLILSGEADRLAPPASGQAIAGKIAQARHLTVQRAGHLLLEERPEAVVEEILAFLHEAPGAVP
ncbi:MAG: alpha/beta fold hydrolase [Dehalococcoidia bacterium]